MEGLESEWKTVNRLKGGNTAAQPPETFNLYTPFNNKPLFSHIVKTPKQPHLPKPKPSPPSTAMAFPSPPHSPQPAKAVYYFSPHSPTRLRFPPSSTFSEWRGRCFRCCRTGHNAAECRNPMRCGKCWGEGHMGSRCSAQTLNPAAMPYWSKNKCPASPPKQVSPFEELLKPCPQAVQAFPNNRPKRLSYHIARDHATLSELTKLASGVVFNTHGHEYNFSLKDVVGFATRTKLVLSSEISIGRLARDRFLILLPHGMAPQTFIESTTPELWDAGFSFQPWSELDGANTVLPEYKVLIDLHNIPPHLFRDEQVQKVVSTFGTYLGTIPPMDVADLSVWTAVVAVHRLETVPEELSLHDLGSEHIITVQPRNWLRSPLYKVTDLPRHQQKFTKPLKARSEHQVDDIEHFAISRKSLRELCKGIDSSALPEEIGAILQGTAPNPTLSMAGVEQLASLPRTAEPLAISNYETGETSHPPPLSDPTHNLAQTTSQPIQQTTNPVGMSEDKSRKKPNQWPPKTGHVPL